MKKMIRRIRMPGLASLIVLSILSISFMKWGGQTPQATIVKPKSGELIENRNKFPVVVSVPSYDVDRKQGFHYWVSVAASANKRLGADHWPKFYVKGDFFEGRVYDGGFNPNPGKEEKMLVLIKVDVATSDSFSDWLAHGASTGKYPALHLKKSQVVAKTLIYFP